MATGSDTRRDRIENTDNFIEQREQFVKTYRAICNFVKYKYLQNDFVVGHGSKTLQKLKYNL